MPSNTTLWPLKIIPLANIVVLKNYMDAWLPIMRRWNGRVLFIDAFAGPGEYAGGQDGSPIIALKSLIDHSARQMMPRRDHFIFIERELDRKPGTWKMLVKQLENEIPDELQYYHPQRHI